MGSAAAGLKVVAAIAVLAVLVMSSEGHPRTKPLCSDCPTQCNTNCTAMSIANCTSECGYQASCDSCRSQVLQLCCQSSCSGNNGTSTYSCCPSDCIGGNCVTCSCCDTTVQNSCTSPCSDLSCQACKNGIGQQCYPSCMSACNDHCVKKHC